MWFAAKNFLSPLVALKSVSVCDDDMIFDIGKVARHWPHKLKRLTPLLELLMACLNLISLVRVEAMQGHCRF